MKKSLFSLTFLGVYYQAFQRQPVSGLMGRVI